MVTLLEDVILENKSNYVIFCLISQGLKWEIVVLYVLLAHKTCILLTRVTTV